MRLNGTTQGLLQRMFTNTHCIRSYLPKTAVCFFFILTSGCGTGCLFVARSSGLSVVSDDQPTPKFNQVIKDAISPFGFVGNNPSDPAEVNFSIGHTGIRFPLPRNTVDIEIDITTYSVRLADFGKRESKFDENVMNAIQQHVEIAYGQKLVFTPEKQPALCLGP
jgi:hypothetical protein